MSFSVHCVVCLKRKVSANICEPSSHFQTNCKLFSQLDTRYTREDLKKVRKSLGLTQEEMAEKIGVSRSFYSKMEAGSKPISERSELLLSKIISAQSSHFSDLLIQNLVKIKNNLTGALSKMASGMLQKERRDQLTDAESESYKILQEQVDQLDKQIKEAIKVAKNL